MFIPLAIMPRLILFLLLKEESDFFKGACSKNRILVSDIQKCTEWVIWFISRGIKLRTKTREVLKLSKVQTSSWAVTTMLNECVNVQARLLLKMKRGSTSASYSVKLCNYCNVKFIHPRFTCTAETFRKENHSRLCDSGSSSQLSIPYVSLEFG